MKFRTERDPLGELDVPADAYYGVQTTRAVENFRISGLRAPADLVTATILVKKAAAEANVGLGRLVKNSGGLHLTPFGGNHLFAHDDWLMRAGAMNNR